ncbi:MAG TPA: NAD(P)-dependent alcohol dehydrogenase [Jiangellales bacterium]|nr:NAD(P)-dependent alcohol dehydrogenase [Jiangellales bacterium]
MKVIAHDHFGSPDVLELRDVDQPQVGDDEVLVRVHAAGLDRGVWHLMAGKPYLVRLTPYSGLRGPKHPVVGSEVSGTVEAVGPAVTRFRTGDEVYGIGKGTFAEYATVPVAKCAPKPANLTYEEAAVVPISGGTALRAVRAGNVRPGRHVLVIGASGGVGSYAVQLAKAFGAEVTGVCSTAKVDLVRSLGADHVIDYSQEEITDGGRRYDVIIDTGGLRPLRTLRRALTPKGSLVIVGAENGGNWTGGIGRAMRAAMLSRFVGQTLVMLTPKERHEDLLELTELIEAGKVTPAVDRTYPLVDVPEAVRYLMDGRARGKVAITV